ncbi:MAG: chloramphenicol acetyltransferase [bacterium]
MKVLRSEPSVDPSAVIEKCQLGVWTEVGARCRLQDTYLGDYSYVMEDCQIDHTSIGKFCSIAAACRINPGNHPLGRAALHHFTYRSFQYGLAADDEEFFQWRRSHGVVLGHDVWLGHGVVVLPGVQIGTGAVIGAGAVVTRDVPPFTVVAGVPARVLRERFSREVQAALLRIGWWNWSHDQLKAALMDFRQLDAQAFVEKYDPV